MLSKLLNQKVKIYLVNFADSLSAGIAYEGTVTNIDENFIELNNEKIITIKYIASINTL